jgi:hypothetical protein
LQIPLKEGIGAKREEIGGETECDFMDNSITPKLKRHKKNQGMGSSIGKPCPVQPWAAGFTYWWIHAWPPVFLFLVAKFHPFAKDIFKKENSVTISL